MEASAITSWINSFENNVHVTEINNNTEKYIGIVEVYPALAHDPGNIRIKYFEQDTETTHVEKYIVYAESSFDYEGETIPAGWSELIVTVDLSGGEEVITYSAVSFIALTEFNFGKSVTVTDVADSFATLNGVVIGTIQGEAPVYYNITANITEGTYDGPETIEKYDEAFFSIDPGEGHDFPASVSVTGATLAEYDEAKGDGMIKSPTGAVTITATCPATNP